MTLPPPASAACTALHCRQRLRLALNKALVFAVARHQGKRLYVWRARDTAAPTAGSDLPGQLPEAVLRALDYMPSSKTDGVGAIQYFFEGIPYVFTDCSAPQSNRVTNNMCYGRQLVLHDEEPEEGPASKGNPVRMLAYIPRGIFVEPVGPPLGSMCGGQGPADCLPVEPCSKVFKPSYPGKMMVGSKDYTGIKVKRKGYPLGEGMVFTDYYSQGMSFKSACWLVDLRVPPDGRLHRASLLVILTRYSSWLDVLLLQPLWPSGDSAAAAAAKRAVIEKFYATTKDPTFLELIMDINRMKHIALQTIQKFGPRFSDASNPCKFMPATRCFH